jgi:hypothetical protein
MNEQPLEKITQKEGPPWQNARLFSSFNEADSFRKSTLLDDTKQVKIKKQINSSGEEIFVVKVRTKISLQTEELSKFSKKSKTKE